MKLNNYTNIFCKINIKSSFENRKIKKIKLNKRRKFLYFIIQKLINLNVHISINVVDF